MVSIFISYSHKDRVVAEILAKKLRDIGYETWIDFEGITGGNKWKKSIDDALKRSSALVVLLTPESIISEWVHYECAQANSYGHAIIPLLIRSCNIPQFLEEYQYIDLLKGFDAGFDQIQKALLSAVITNVKKRGHISETPEPTMTLQNAGEQVQKQIGKARILIIEDTPQYQELLKDIFLEFDVEVDIASNRSEAAQFIKETSYSFISLDMQLTMEDFDGESGKFLLNIWTRYQPKTPLVIISSRPFDKNQTRDFLKKYAVLDMLDKPLNQEVLMDLLKQYLPFKGKYHET